MNCEKFEGLLIDFMVDEIDPSDRDLVNKHLITCAYCSKRLEEYLKIRRVFNQETLTQPSTHVLATLTRRARQEITRDIPPFWKRWFYSPILVPVLSSALAVLVWVYHGQKDTEFSQVKANYSREATAKKAPMTEELPTLIWDKASGKIGPNKPGVSSEQSEKRSDLQGVREKTLGDLESNPGRVLSSDSSSVNPQAFGKKERIQEESEMNIGPASPEELVARMETKEADKISQEEASRRFEAKSINEPAPKQPNKTGEESFKQEATAQVQPFSYREIGYDEQLNLALNQQKEGNCEASIKTNEELLKAIPSPSDLVKGKAYISLAECYEKKGDLVNAIINYENLKNVSPRQATFAKGRIERLRIMLLKTRELKPSNTE
jgi:hypothetical protein